MAKAVKGQAPWDDPLDFLKDQFIDSTPISGPLIETATEGGDWGKAGLTSGISLVGAAIPALGALGSGAATAADTASTVADAAAAAGTAAESLGTVADVAGAAGGAAATEALGAIPEAVTAAATGLGDGLANAASSVDSAFGAVADTVSAVPRQIGQGLVDTIGEVPTDILRNSVAQAGAGALKNHDSDPGRGALLGGVGGLVGSGLNLAGSAIPGMSAPETGLAPGTGSADLMTQDQFSPVPDVFNPQFTPEVGATDAMSQYSGSVFPGVTDDNYWRDLGDTAIQGGVGVGKSAIRSAAMSPIAQAMAPAPVVPRPQIDPYEFFRTLPGVTRRRLL